MKSRRYVLMAAAALGLLIPVSAPASVSNDQVQSQHIREADGTSGQNTNSGAGVKTGHIQNGAVTDAKISGPISASKISTTGLNADTVDGKHAADLAPAVHSHSQSDVNGLTADLAGKAPLIHAHDAADLVSGVVGVERLATYHGMRIVHQGPADNVNTFSTITAAIQSITDNSATNRYSILVMPGVYVENIVVPDYIDIIGQSRASTIIEDADLTMNGQMVVIMGKGALLSHLTVRVKVVGYAVHLQGEGSSMTDCDVEITAGWFGGNYTQGVYASGTGHVIENIRITGDYGSSSVALIIDSTDNARMTVRNVTMLGAFEQGMSIGTPDTPDNPLLLTDIRIIPDFTYFGIRLMSGHLKLQDVSIDPKVTIGNCYISGITAIWTNVPTSTVRASSSVIGMGETCASIANVFAVSGDVWVDNSVIKGNIANGAGTVSIGNSRITGSIAPQGSGQVKTVGCYNNSYEPIANGLH